ncbi:MAG TPA: TonB-dependent receptor [Gammaproteobacteria bacterium]|nr:TonB-dependent receptor [Gammaproteobacteria bacterium]
MKCDALHTTQRLTVRPLTAAIAAVLGSGYAAGPALAQGGAAARQVQVDEMVVTASRRETTVQELPFNIAAISGATLERQRLTSLTEFSRWVPGLTVVDQGPRGSNLMTVRGLNVRSLNASEFLDNTSGNTVATYLGEVPLYVDFKMKDLERVEVLLGPQGTLYGAGTLGGAVRYIPTAPDTQDFSFDVHGDLVSLAHGSSLGYGADATVNVPIVEGRLAFRGAFSYVDDPGFIDYPFLVRQPGVSNPEPNLNNPADVAANLYREDDANWEQTTSGRLALLWDVSDTVRATFNYYFQDQEVGGRSINHRDAFQTGNYESGLRFLEPNDRENHLVSVELVADLGFAQLTSATGVSDFEQLGQRDQTDLLLTFGAGYETFPSFAAFTRDALQEDRISQEVRLVSSGAGPWGWIVGAFYNDFDYDATSEEFAPGWDDFIGVSLPTGDLEYLQLTREKLQEQAVFGEVSYQLSQRSVLTLGGRFFDYETDKRLSVDVPFFTPLSGSEGNLGGDDGFLGKVNFAYEFSDDVTGYATVSEGYRIGGVNSIVPCILPLPPGQNVCALPDEVLILPDRTTNFEVGVHSTLRDGTLLFNGSVYTIDWDDVQTLSTTQNGALPITVNGGGARSRGLELAIQTRGMEHWTFTAAYAYNDAELTTDAPGLVDRADAFAGDRLSGTPQHQGSFYTNYYRALGNGWDLDVAYGFTFSSDVLTKVGLRSDGETLGGYTVHNASVSLSKDAWSASLYADNLTDKFAETAVRLDSSYIGSSGLFQLRNYFHDVLRPRSIGIEFRYSFGE